jgi:hypothetical protein
MKKPLIALLLSLATATSLSAHASLDDFIRHVDVQARADLDRFSARIGAHFGIPVPEVRVVLKTVKSPADVFMVFELGRMARIPHARVLDVYQAHRDKGWGAMARELGIKPGSRDFHALKEGNFRFGGYRDDDGAEDRRGKSRPDKARDEDGHGHGHGHGKGRSHD